MKKAFLILVVVIFSFTCCTCVLAKEDYAPDQIIIELSPDVMDFPAGVNSADPQKITVNSGSVKKLHDKYKIKKIEKLFKDVKTRPSRSPGSASAAAKDQKIPDLSNFYIIQFPEGYNVSEIVELYKKDPGVVSASLNHKTESFLVPNDPKFNDFPTYFNQWGLFKINIKKAWDITTGSQGVTIAVIDTGVNYVHEDMEGKVIKGFNYVSNNYDPMDDNGHGTHVAGIIGALTNNAIGIAGISWNSKILAIKILDSRGQGYTAYSAAAMVYAADNGANIINMSYGSFYRDPYEEAAVNYAYSKGCVLVAAAGNYGTGTPMYPAAFDHVIAVASTDINDRKSNYSNFGPWVDISAPGGDTSYDPKSRILSTFYDNNYVWMMGTSMAAPYVSGVAALVGSVRPAASPDEIEARLKNSADDISYINPAYIGYLGAGRLNAYRAANIYSMFLSVKDGSSVHGIVPIKGTASYEAFKFYKLKWAAGTDPKEEEFSSEGILLADEGRRTVEDGLLGTWNTEDKFGTYTLKLSINDWSSLESVVVMNVGNIDALGLSESGPNPFNPSIGQKTKIKYVLPGDTEVKLYIFDITATLVYSKTYPSGDPDGGHTGNNIIEWDGSSKFGGIVANGAYIFKIAASGQQIGKGKIIVIK